MVEIGGAGCSQEKGDHEQGLTVFFILLNGGAGLIKALVVESWSFFCFFLLDIGLAGPGVGCLHNLHVLHYWSLIFYCLHGHGL